MPEKSQNAVSMSNLVFRYPSSPSVLHCENWSLPKGERVFLYGDSGSGKSTLLSLLSGITQPSSGTICLGNTCLNDLPSAQLDQYRANNIGVVFQQFNLIPYLSVLQNVQLAAHFAQSSEVSASRLTPMLENLKLSSDLLEKQVSQLSVGQKQRVAIMRALINSPELLLIDEPTSALDANARDGFMQMLMSMEETQQTSMIFVSHDQALRGYFDQQVAIDNICHWSKDTQGDAC
ncbi:ABC transporter ATP-binding protein [Aliiglaciecola sp. M165]|uniref:ABC transporter ATP-binding protein n=1 Tax=Aliiglaciecola sp. M165 TaxID=2593649 RepID=UPI001180B10E|nr:ABC transporter ATP-binding protein [Aliiglaciecola sp. M165]TRY33742.1 ABC transporter ATP-binding protein [Aliiglaciecola sp. M165]